MTDLTDIKAAENHLQSLMKSSDKNVLAQGVRLLALYVAAFKEQYGDLDHTVILAYLKEEADQPETMRIFETGLQEAIAMLSMVRTSDIGAGTNSGKLLLN